MYRRRACEICQEDTAKQAEMDTPGLLRRVPARKLGRGSRVEGRAFLISVLPRFKPQAPVLNLNLTATYTSRFFSRPVSILRIRLYLLLSSTLQPTDRVVNPFAALYLSSHSWRF